MRKLWSILIKSILFFTFYCIFLHESISQTILPSNISNLQLWLKADSNITLNGNNISQWNDCSGNNNNTSQANINNQPLLVNNSLNNKPVIRFDGSNDYLSGNFNLTTDKLTLFIVCSPLTQATGKSALSLYNSAEGKDYGSQNSLIAFAHEWINNGTGAYRNGFINWSSTFFNTPKIYTLTATGAFLKTFLNGISANQMTSTGNFNIDKLIIGSGFVSNAPSRYMNLDIAEIIIYNRSLSTTEQQQIEQYLHYKYAPPVSLGPDINITNGFCDTTLNAGSRFTSFIWSTGATSQTINVDSPGFYSVTVTDIFGLTSSDTIKVTYPKINLNDTLFCSGSTVTLSTGLSGAYTYNWTGGLTTPSINVSSPGNYSVTVTDNASCSKVSDTISVTEDNFPTLVDLGPDANLCAGNTIGLIAPNPLPSGLSYIWSNGATTANIAVTASGLYTLTVTNTNVCSATDNINVTIIGNAPNTDYTYIKGCSGKSTTFTNTSIPAGVSWLWDFGDGQTSTLQNPSHIFTSGGNYNVKLTVSDGLCSSSTTKTIHIPSSPIPSFTASQACINNPITIFDESTSSEGNIISWDWDFGDGTIHSLDTNPTHTFTTADTYIITLTINTDSLCTASLQKPITVVSSAAAPSPFTLYLPSNNYVTTSKTIAFAWNNALNAIKYSLQYSTDSTFNSNVISISNLTANFVQLTINTPQTYYWRVIAYGLCGDMVNSSNKSIFSIFAPNFFSDLQLWLKADSNITLNGNNVSEWKDCSGNNNNTSQANINNQPLLVNNSLNNKPVIRFDGSNDYLSGNINLTTDKLTFFIVCTPLTQATSISALSLYNSAEGKDYGSQNSLIAFAHEWNNNGTGAYRNGFVNWSSSFFNTPKIYTLTATGVFLKTFLNGISANQINSTGNFNIDKLIIGSGFVSNAPSRYMNLNIAEIIVYNNALADSNRIKIENYLRYKYAPPVNLGPDIWGGNFCKDTIFASNRFLKYKWNTAYPADTLNYLVVNSGGTYSVTATDVFGFNSTDEIIVHKPIITAKNTMACYGSTVTLNSGLTSPYTFLWEPSGAVTPSISVTAPHIDTLTVYDTVGCFTRKTIITAADSFAVKASLGSATITRCTGDSVYLLKGAGAAVNYDWWNGTAHSYNPAYTVNWPIGTYPLFLAVTDTMNCVANLSVNVAVPGAQPNVNFSFSPVCFPGPVNTGFDDISAAVSGNLNSWKWNFNKNDSAIYYNSNPFNHSFDSAAVYDVKLTVSTNQGCKGSIIKKVPVYSVPKPAFNPLLGCSGVPVLLKDKSTNKVGNILTYNWKINDPNSTQNNSNDTNFLHTFNEVGTYGITHSVISQNGCTDSIKDSITIRTAPLVGFNYTKVCDGMPVYFNDTSVTQPWTNILKWFWNFGNGQTSTLKNPVCYYDSAGTYPVSLTVNSMNGCEVTKTSPIVVHALPDAAFTADDICAASPYKFTDVSTVNLPDTIALWNWNFGNGQTSGFKNPLISLPDTGSYSVSLLVKTNAGCEDSVRQNIYVNPVPVAAFMPDNYYGVSPFPVVFTNNTEGAINYLWNFGDNTGSSTLANPTYTYTSNGIYTVSLLAYNQYGCKDSVSEILTVIPTIADIAVSNIKAVKENNFISISADITNLGSRRISLIHVSANVSGGSSFMETWENTLNPLEPGEKINFTFNGQVEISEESSTKFICVEAQIPNYIPDNNPQDNEQCISFSNEFIAFEPYPSPAIQQINIDFILPFSDMVEIVLYDSKGEKIKTIYSGNAEKGLNKLLVDISSYNLGVYTYRINFRNDLKIFKFVKY